MYKGYAVKNSIKINYIDNQILDSQKTPLIICPGLSEECTDYESIVKTLSDRRCVALSFRGRGNSSNADNGYTLEKHIEDIDLVVNELRLDKFCLMGYSRGVSYALGYVISNLNKIRGLIVGEYPAEHKNMNKGWAKEQMDVYNRHDLSVSITYDVLKSIEIDSKYKDFSTDLNKVKCPTLILKGEKEDTLLSTYDISKYINNLGSKSIRIEKFSNSGHDIMTSELFQMIISIKNFLNYIDLTNL